MTSPGPNLTDDTDMSPGSPRWYLTRLTQKLLGRHADFDKLERYALGHHDYPNGDKRYVAALRDLQKKARTNYIELVIKAVIERMRVKEFRLGTEEEPDEDSRKIWKYNDMDYQAPMMFMSGATFGECYVLVSPPDEEDGEPVITVEDPKMCIIEQDPTNRTRTLAGLKMWQDDVLGVIVAVLYLPDATYVYHGHAVVDNMGTDAKALLTRLTTVPDAGGFELVSIEDNPYGKVPLIRGPWQPAFAPRSRGEAENVMDIQDRINHTILDRLVIAKSQAYNQRWATGLHKPKGKRDSEKPPFNPGADMVWATYEPDAKFGQFDAADIKQILEAIRDDVGDLAATSQTPATYLMNRMVNVSGDTLTQDQSALVSKIKLRQDAMAWMLEQILKMCFLIKGEEDKAQEPEWQVIWFDPEIRTLAEQADALNKLVSAGVPLQIAMQRLGFTSDEIKIAVEEQQKVMEREMQMAEQQMRLEADNQIRVEKAKPKPTSKPSSGKSGSKK